MKRFVDGLKFTGFILTGITAVGYLFLLYILIDGFDRSVENSKLLIFLVLGSIVGVIMNFGLRVQGVDLAKVDENSKKIIDENKNLKVKDKETKLQKLWVFHTLQLIKDLLGKGTATVVTFYFSITIIVEGLGDFKYFYLGIANILLYLGLGLIGLAKSYNFTLEHVIPNIAKENERIKEEIKNAIREDERTNSNEIRIGEDTRRDQRSEVPRTELKRNRSFTGTIAKISS